MKKKEKNNIKRRQWTIRIAVIVGILLLLLLLCFCGRKDYGVSFQIGDNVYTMVNIRHGGKVEEPKVPTKEGYTFQGWYWNDKKFDFNSEITKDVILEARFEENIYTVTVDDGNGNQIELHAKHKEAISEPKVGEKRGYYFAGWYVDGEEFHFEDGVTKDTQVEGKWALNEHALYRVEHYLQEKDGTYPKTYKDIEILDGKTNSTVTPATHTYRGYQTPSKKSVKVESDGTTIVKYYYSLKIYTLVVVGGAGIDSVSGSGKYYYGDEVKIGYTLKDGYHFSGYSRSLDGDIFAMPDENVGIEVMAEANADTPYRVEHYLQNIDESYPETPEEIETLKGKTDSQVKPDTHIYEGFTAPQKREVVIDGKGTTVIKYYYTRNKYHITITGDRGIASLTQSGDFYYGDEIKIEATLKSGYALKEWSTKEQTLTISYQVKDNDTVTVTTTPIKYTITYELEGGEGETSSQYTVEDKVQLPTPKRGGYTFRGWYLDQDYQKGPVTELENSVGNLTLYAKWEANPHTKYLVKHYYMNVAGNYDGVKPVEEEQEGRTGATTSITDRKVKEGFTFDSSKSDTEKEISGEEETIVSYYYVREKYDVKVQASTGIEKVTGSGSYYFEQEVEVTAALKMGYENLTWEGSVQEVDGKTILTVPVGGITVTAKATPKENTPYTVKHHFMNKEGDGYLEPIVDYQIGTTDETIRVSPREVDGFNVPEEQSLTITGDGLASLDFYYERNQYTVTITTEEGVTSKISSITDYFDKEIEITFDNLSFNPGYRFVSWVIDGVETTEEDITLSIPSHHVNILVKAEKIPYQVTFKNDNPHRKNSKPVTYYYGDSITEPEFVDWEHHDFQGWYLENVDGSLASEAWNFKEDTMPARNITLVAKWKIHKGTLNFNFGFKGVYQPFKNVNYDTTVEELLTREGKSLEDYTSPTHQGYKFLGWYPSRDFEKAKPIEDILHYTMPDPEEMGMEEQGITLYANWKPYRYQVEFNANGGKGTMEPQDFTFEDVDFLYHYQYHDEDTIKVPLSKNQYTKDGYTFQGWSKTLNGPVDFKEEEAVANLICEDGATVSLYAVWKANDYEVAYHPNGGTGTMPNSKHIYDEEKSLSENEFTKEGYHFVGWTKNLETNELIKENKNYTTDGVVDVYAVWEANTYTVTYDPNKEIGSSEPKGEVGQTTHMYDRIDSLSKSSYTRDGYTFLGWSLTKQESSVDRCDDCITEANNLTSDNDGNVIVYAVWRANDYTVTYDSNNGTGTVETTNHRYDTKTSLSTKEYTRKGYTFLGWSQTKHENSVDRCDDCITEAYNLTATENENVIVYAVWKIDTYTIKYEDSKNGTLETKNKESYTVEDSFTLSKPTKEGYTFLGWYKKGTDEKVESISKGSTGYLELEARWEIVSYTITCIDNLNTTTEITYTVESGATIDNPDSKVGYTFEGWYENESFTGNKVSSYDIGTTGNKTVYANWREHTYKIKYAGKEGEETYKYTDQVTLKGNSEYTKKWTVTYDYNDNGATEQKEEPRSLSYQKWKVQGTDTTYDVNYTGSKLTSSDNAIIVLEPDWVNPTLSNSELETPTRTGYNFKEWQLNGKAVTSEKMEITEDITLIAEWVAKTYKVTYESGIEGVDPITDTFTFDGVNRTRPDNTFTKSYQVTWKDEIEETNTLYATLTGWKIKGSTDGICYEPDTDVKNQLSKTGEDNITLEACWKDPTITPTNKEKTGYQFDGWYKDEDSKVEGETTVSSNLTLHAKWTPIKYKVKFQYGDSKVIEKEFEYNSLTNMTPSVKELAKTYTVTFETEGSSVDSKDYSANIECWQLNDSCYQPEEAVKLNLTADPNTTIVMEAKWKNPTIQLSEIPGTTKTGYTFQYWSHDGEEITDGFEIVESITLTANFREHTYTIVYQNGEEVVRQENIKYTESITLKNSDLFKKSYNLTYRNGKDDTISVPLSYDKWIMESQEYETGKSYSQLTSIDGGEVILTPKWKNPTITEFKKVEKLGYDFAGWYDETSKRIDNQDSYTLTKDTVLEAHWNLHTYSITYQNYDACADCSSKASYTIEDNFELPVPTKEGYDFQGWYTTTDYQENTKVPSITAGTTGDKTLYAKWELHDYTITFVDKLGDSTDPMSYTIESGATLPQKGIQNGYTFDGWCDTEDCKNGIVSALPKGTTGDKTFYAKRTGIDYTVIYSKEGTDEVTRETLTYGQGHTAASGDIMKTPYTVTFDANGGNPVSSQTVNATVASWKIKDSSNGNTYPANQSMGDLITPTATGQTVTLVPNDWTYPTITLPAATKEADKEHYVEYQLDGWYQETTKWTEKMPVMDDIKLTAKWQNMIDTETYINDSLKDTSVVSTEKKTKRVTDAELCGTGWFGVAKTCDVEYEEDVKYENGFTHTIKDQTVTIDMSWIKGKATLQNSSSFLSATKKLLSSPGVSSVVLIPEGKKEEAVTLTGSDDDNEIISKVQELINNMTDTSSLEVGKRWISSLYDKSFTMQMNMNEGYVAENNQEGTIAYKTVFTSDKVISKSDLKNITGPATEEILKNNKYSIAIDANDSNKIKLEYTNPDLNVLQIDWGSFSASGEFMGAGIKTAFWRLIGNPNRPTEYPATFMQSITITLKGTNVEREIVIKPDDVSDKVVLSLGEKTLTKWHEFGLGLQNDLEKAFGMKTDDITNQVLTNFTSENPIIIQLNVGDNYALQDGVSLTYSLTVEKK